MESLLQLDVVTPDKTVISSVADYVGVPGVEGQFGVLPSHVPLLSALTIGELYYRVEGRLERAFISGGFAEVSDNRVTILAEAAELAQDIDTARAQEAKRRAEARLASRTEGIDETRATAALQRAVHRLSVAQLG